MSKSLDAIEKDAISNAVRSLIENDAWELVDQTKHVS